MVSVSDAKRILEGMGATHLVIFCIDEYGVQHVATHGDTEANALEAAEAGNRLKSALGWPETLCNASPTRRIHRNCAYYKPDYGAFCTNGWSRDGSDGYCVLYPNATKKDGDEHGCRWFDPKG